MRVFGFAIPVVVLIIGAYLIGVKFPGIGQKVLGAASGAVGAAS